MITDNFKELTLDQLDDIRGWMDSKHTKLFIYHFFTRRIQNLRISNDTAQLDKVKENQGAIKELRNLIVEIQEFDDMVEKALDRLDNSNHPAD